jgi:hypothetical protein
MFRSHDQGIEVEVGIGMQEQESPLTRVGSRGVTPDGVLLELFDLSGVSVTAHNLISFYVDAAQDQTLQW